MTTPRALSQEQARRLAIAYAAYTQAVLARDGVNGVKWAAILANMQRETGVTLIAPETLADHGALK